MLFHCTIGFQPGKYVPNLFHKRHPGVNVLRACKPISIISVLLIEAKAGPFARYSFRVRKFQPVLQLGQWGQAHKQPFKCVKKCAGNGHFRIAEIPAQIGTVRCDQGHGKDRDRCAERNQRPVQDAFSQRFSLGKLQIDNFQLFTDCAQNIRFRLRNRFSQQGAHGVSSACDREISRSESERTILVPIWRSFAAQHLTSRSAPVGKVPWLFESLLMFSI